jgi:H2-forming N5,N10-methylenetetrahydromethanopterin dehydrogenase-like enzyme
VLIFKNNQKLKKKSSSNKLSSSILKLANPNRKIVYQYKADKISLVAEYSSLRHAESVTGLSRKYIVKCINSQKLTYNNFWFSFIKL